MEPLIEIPEEHLCIIREGAALRWPAIRAETTLRIAPDNARYYYLEPEIDRKYVLPERLQLDLFWVEGDFRYAVGYSEGENVLVVSRNRFRSIEG